MPEKVFESMITLKFINPDIQKEYKTQEEKNLKQRAIIFSTILMILNLTNILLLNFDHSDQFFFCYLQICSYIITGITAVTLTIIIFTRNKDVLKISNYINFFISCFTKFILRIYFADYLKTDVFVLALIYTIQNLYIVTWYYSNSIDFYPGLILTVLKSITLYLTFGFLLPTDNHFRFSINAFVYLFTSFLAYTYVYERKKSFYYFKLMEIGKGYYQNILENMNSGFLCISGDKVKYINKALISTVNLPTSDEVAENINIREQENFSKINVHSLLKELLNDIELNNCIKESIRDDQNQPEVEDIINYLKTNTSSKFYDIGTNHLKLSDGAFCYYEISARYYITSYNNEENLEFIFNDVSNIKNKEEINAAFKYKTMFLSKVAHEFKNPILCITELVDQVSEQIKIDKNGELSIDNYHNNNTSNILRSIKSMSNYLIILIKDMDFFSIKNQNISNIKLDKDLINVGNFITFIKDITNILIKKFDKQNHVSFEVKHSSFLPAQIYTDELRLKQILINLLSNSVKYTMNGEIILEIIFEGDRITFIIKDTGMGIPDNKLDSLFQPFMPTDKNYNNISAGLGLFIVKEILELFGSNITYEHNEPIGSKFKFSLDLIMERDIKPFYSTNSIGSNHSKKSKATVMVDYQPAVHSPLKHLFYKNSDEFTSFSLGANQRIITLESPVTEVSKCLGNVIVVDDEIMTRKSTIRMLLNFCRDKGINLNILEAGDGMECLGLYYQSFKEGMKILMIISDQTMTFLNGYDTAKILHNVNVEKGLVDIPFFILTAYEEFVLGDGVKCAYSKPLMNKHLEDIFSEMCFFTN
jgi:signal transduction histidine kinase